MRNPDTICRAASLRLKPKAPVPRGPKKGVTMSGQKSRETQPETAAEEEAGGHRRCEAQDSAAPALHSLLGHYARLLWDVQKLRIQVRNRIGAMERDGLPVEATAPHLETQKTLEAQERGIERQLERLVKQHPMADWVKACPGLGYGGFARIVGVTGDFMLFPNVAKVWAYMGMHVVNGHAPKREKGVKSNWSPQGRVVAHQIGDSIVKLGRGRYRELYDAKKAEYLARPRLGNSGCPMGQVHKDKGGKVLACVKPGENGNETSAHLHNAAMRVAVKELLKDMWVEWHRRAIEVVQTRDLLPPVP
jgi:hypothetical protein